MALSRRVFLLFVAVAVATFAAVRPSSATPRSPCRSTCVPLTRRAHCHYPCRASRCRVRVRHARPRSHPRRRHNRRYRHIRGFRCTLPRAVPASKQCAGYCLRGRRRAARGCPTSACVVTRCNVRAFHACVPRRRATVTVARGGSAGRGRRPCNPVCYVGIAAHEAVTTCEAQGCVAVPCARPSGFRCILEGVTRDPLNPVIVLTAPPPTAVTTKTTASAAGGGTSTVPTGGPLLSAGLGTGGLPIVLPGVTTATPATTGASQVPTATASAPTTAAATLTTTLTTMATTTTTTQSATTAPISTTATSTTSSTTSSTSARTTTTQVSSTTTPATTTAALILPSAFVPSTSSPGGSNVAVATLPPPTEPQLKTEPRINEFHYDNTGTDTGELIELVSDAREDLTGYTIALYNGGSGAVYDRLAIADATETIADGVRYSVLNLATDGIQNDDEGIALVDAAGNVVEFICYEGTLTPSVGPAAGLTCDDVGVQEDSATPVGHSVQRMGCGTETSWTVAAASAGGINACQAFEPCPLQTTATWINEIHYDNSGADVDEAVEIAAEAGTDLTGWTVVRYNGQNNAVYGTDTLTGVVADTANGVGFTVVRYPLNGLQNDREGVALVDASGSVVEFVCYEGSITAADGPAAGTACFNIGVQESSTTVVGTSMQRVGCGAVAPPVWDTGLTATLGAVNEGQAFEYRT